MMYQLKDRKMSKAAFERLPLRSETKTPVDGEVYRDEDSGDVFVWVSYPKEEHKERDAVGEWQRGRVIHG